MSETCLICNHERFQHEEYGCDVFGCACPKTANDVSDSIIDELRQDRQDLLEALNAMTDALTPEERLKALDNAIALIARMEE